MYRSRIPVLLAFLAGVAAAASGAGCASIQERVTALEDSTAALESRLVAVERDQRRMLERLDQVRAELEGSLDPLRTQQADRGEDLRSLQRQASALESQIELLEERITVLTEELATTRREALRWRSQPPDASAAEASREGEERQRRPMPLPPGAEIPQATSQERGRQPGAEGREPGVEGRQPAAEGPEAGPSREAEETSPADASAVGAEALYRTAYGDYLKSNYDLAITGFSQYLARFPQTDRADNALYWIGESQYAQGDYVSARETFLRILLEHPRGDVVPGAMLKGALALLELGRPAPAAEELRQLVAAHPARDEARIACLQLERLGETSPPACRDSGRNG